MLSEPHQKSHAAILIGFESSGKSALFRGLTGQDTGEEANFRGSTIMARSANMITGVDLTDLPGIRIDDDSRTTQLALEAITDADIVVLVVRATHAANELPQLLKALNIHGKRTMLILTFADKTQAHLSGLVNYYSEWLRIPVRAVNARKLKEAERKDLLQSFEMAKPFLPKVRSLHIPSFPIVHPQSTWFEHPIWGRPLSLMAMFLLFALPVLLAYVLSTWLQPIADLHVIEPIKSLFEGTAPLIRFILVGDYGVLTLGWYSFLWAFPVVLLLGISVALAEESGIKDRITDSLDGWMRLIGLNGRDLIPVLSGFGCNVVAVFQSRACSACTRKSCVSLITFGSACSYQIGASLSIFGSAGHPWLFLPYLFILGLVGAVHTRLWNRNSGGLASHAYASKTFLQKPGIRAVSWRVRAVIKQFLLQAMPIFIVICLIATILQLTGILEWISGAVAPFLQLLRLPAEAASGIIFSILRKDGLLILNQDNGALLQTMNGGQVFVLVYLASTLTACLVTLWTVRKEMGLSFASSLAGKQIITSLISTAIITFCINIL